MENATNNADSLACRCRGVIEWINCLLFDNLLLILEAGINLWMATRLGSSTYPIYKLYFVWISLNFKDFFGPAALIMVYLSTPRNNSPSPKVFFSHLNYLCNFRSWHSKLICMDYAIENTQGK